MAQTFEIKNRFTDEVLFSYELAEGQESGMIARHALEAAISSDADLSDANLRGVDLRGVDLRGADLSDSDLSDSDLSDSDLSDANLRGADLRDADLYEADLRGADLSDANLRGADLSGADLRDADLYEADLRGADLSDANLRGAKNVPLLINGLAWLVVIDGIGNMRIGCQSHSIEQWCGFTDDEISEVDSNALEFWNKHKAMLLAICDSYKHDI